ncbi:23S rRNA (adenine-N6)-dimethyltransferase [Friedmanniella luteola]|uniref:23S rRNA (Adenine-N6)-dimethyltransferase n=1 Tax=Friedmanniella luteola TaxID=546871 RepID=A0A1H2A4H9_9ACTN|nr:rRNA adenine N-6-methyltransferase family protein [Friedmanniella luteola]SDT40809.1 23S rRNA (adenine-N6)-dimethyltransferase [Friedmanniella luteola]
MPGAHGGPERRWGWHRLHADRARRLVEAAQIRPGDLVLDLGAGDGALTEPLRAAGARVLAVELHPGRAARLRARFAAVPGREAGTVTVVEADLEEFRWPTRPFRVVANPPWTLGLPLLRTLTARRSALLTAHLVLPRGLVQQAAGSRRRGLGPEYAGSALDRVPPRAFSPPPPGPAGVLEVRRAGWRP